VTSFFGIVGAFFFRFLKQQDGFVPNIFSGFRTKHFITPCIKKQSTLPLNIFTMIKILFLNTSKL